MRKKRRHSATFYFFPALIPLAELLPWVLGLLGAVAGVAGFSLPAFLRKHRMKLIALSVLLLLGAGGVYLYHRPAAEVQETGTRLIKKELLPVPKLISQASAAPSIAYTMLTPLWAVKTPFQVLSTPVLSGGLLVYGTYGNTVEAAGLDGKNVWSLPVKGPVFAMTKGKGDIVYSGEGLHQNTSSALTAIESKTGKVIWQREFLGHLEGEVTLSDDGDMLWLGTGPGGLWALNAQDGSVVWHQPLGHIDGEPLLHEGVIYVPADVDEKQHKAVLFALDAKTGKIKWQLPQPGQPWGSPLIDKTGKILLTTTGQGQIGIQKETDAGWAQGVLLDGTLIWQIEMPGMIVQPSIYITDADLIIHTAKTGEIVAVRGADGAIVWKEKAAAEFQAAASLADGKIFGIGFDGTFTVRSALTGKEMMRSTLGSRSTASPIAENDIVYIPGSWTMMAVGGIHTLKELK